MSKPSKYTKRPVKAYIGATYEIHDIGSSATHEIFIWKGKLRVSGECGECSYTLSGQKRTEDDPSCPAKAGYVDGSVVVCGNCRAEYEITFAS